MSAEVDRFLEDAVHNGVFPGVAVAAGSANKGLYAGAAGTLFVGKGAPVDRNTCYDVASLTKVMVTGLLCAIAHGEERLSLDQPAATYVPPLREKFTVRELLAHASGLPAWRPYYEDISPGTTPRLAKEAYLDRLASEPLEMPPGQKAIYSDLGFILLGTLLEKVFDRDLATLANERIFKPGGLEHTRFGPVRDAAPTEECPIRKKVVQGEVDDLNAWALGGVAGHAGIFSTAADVERFAQLILRNLQGEALFLKPEILHAFTERQSLPAGSTWALSWDTPSETNSSAGEKWSKTGIGHLGYTGCSLWLDPDRDFYVACLSNRVHPSTKNWGIKNFRPALHDLLLKMFAPQRAS